jgi:peptide/nickel transport system substrate-binding protein
MPKKYEKDFFRNIFSISFPAIVNHSTQNTTNITHLNNPRIDKLLEDGRKTLDLNLRKSIYSDFQRFLVEEVPAIFLFYPETYTLTRN